MLRTIDEIRQDMNWSDDWRFSRIDYAFNISEEYEATTKLTRLLLLVVGEALTPKLQNRYLSSDPLTDEVKTIKVCSSKQKSPQYAIEHYNRAMLDQTQYEEKVINRLEFRLAGRAISDNRNAYASVEAWLIKINEALTKEKNLHRIERARAELFKAKCHKKKDVFKLIRENKEGVYTRNQIALMLEPLCEADELKEIVKGKTRSRANIELFSAEDLRRYAEVLKAVFERDKP